jgi:hypothetical protein
VKHGLESSFLVVKGAGFDAAPSGLPHIPPLFLMIPSSRLNHPCRVLDTFRLLEVSIDASKVAELLAVHSLVGLGLIHYGVTVRIAATVFNECEVIRSHHAPLFSIHTASWNGRGSAGSTR